LSISTSRAELWHPGCVLPKQALISAIPEPRIVYARLLEDVALKDETYKAPSSTPTAGETTIAMTSGDPTLMGLHVGDYIIIRDSDGTTAQVNRVTAVADTELTTLIPITVAAADYIHAVRQAEV